MFSSLPLYFASQRLETVYPVKKFYLLRGGMELWRHFGELLSLVLYDFALYNQKSCLPIKLLSSFDAPLIFQEQNVFSQNSKRSTDCKHLPSEFQSTKSKENLYFNAAEFTFFFSCVVCWCSIVSRRQRIFFFLNFFLLNWPVICLYLSASKIMGKRTARNIKQMFKKTK